MTLSEFASKILEYYPQFARQYSPMKVIRGSLECNAVIGDEVVGVLKTTKKRIAVYIKLPSGGYLYSDGSGSYVSCDIWEFANNIVT